ncbi:MAG: IS481 family transposase [Gaiellaceae bacterium]
MQLHRNAKLGLAGRFALVSAVESGVSIREAARRHGVSPATACEWWHRWRDASASERGSLVCLLDRSSRPRSSPRMLSPRDQERICEARRKTGWGPRQLAARLGRPHATISKTLKRNGCSRRERAPREPANRYEWPCPGDLLHMDSSSYARFERPGHAVTGDRHTSGADKRAAVGYDYAHAVVDDHSRLAYAELLPNERADTVVAFTKRALRFFETHGIQAKRLMTDNAWCYTHSRDFRSLLAARGIKHLTTEPYRPRTNGKVERFHQTMAREWAYGLHYRHSSARHRALPHWLNHYG